MIPLPAPPLAFAQRAAVAETHAAPPVVEMIEGSSLEAAGEALPAPTHADGSDRRGELWQLARYLRSARG